MAVTIQLRCPACGKYLAFGADKAGTISVCDACGGPVVVPEIPPEQLDGFDPTIPPPREDEPVPQPRAPFPAPPPGLLVKPVVPVPQAAPVAPVADEPVIVRRSGPNPQLSAASTEALNQMLEAAKPVPAAPARAVPPPPLEPPRVPTDLPSAIPEYLPGPAAEAGEDRPESNAIIWIASVGAVVVILGAIFIIWFTLLRRPTWEAAHRDRIMSLMHDGESAALHGDPAWAYRKYRELELLVEDQTITDPKLQEDLDTAKRREDQMFELAAANQTSSPPPATTEAVVAQTQPVSPPQTQEVAVNTLPDVPQPVVVPPAPPVAPPANPAPAPPASSAPPAARRPNIRHVPPPPPLLGPTGANIPDDEAIGRSIRQGVEVLIDAFDSRGRLRTDAAAGYSEQGADALAVYSLLQAGQAIDDPRLSLRGPFMSEALDALKKMPMDDGYATYSRALRALALSLAGRPEDMQALRDELRWFEHAGETGNFRYINRSDVVGNPGMAAENEFSMWDNSNTQYGLLGVWAVADAGIDVPDEFWYKLQRHWLATQLPDGEWGYTQSDSSGRTSMTMAGIASLFVTHDYLTLHDREAGALPTQLLQGLAWLETDDHCLITDRGLFSRYAVYGLERVGLASGFKYFGAHDWYPEMASSLLQDQQLDGSWGGGGSVLETSFAVLFLSRGRHPVVASKLRFDGRWDDHPRDLANLSHYASAELERPLNWQVVPATRPSLNPGAAADDAPDAWRDWGDSPILFISSDHAPALNEDTEKKMRDYVLNGGLIVTQTEENGIEFQQWSDDLGRRLFPGRDWRDLAPTDRIYNLALPAPTHPGMKAIDNGARFLMLNLPEDVSFSWKTRVGPADQSAMNLGVNLFVYASGKTEFRNRLEGTYIPPVPDSSPPQASINMVLLNTGAEPDPEPVAWTRFANWFRRQTDLQVKLQGPVALGDVGKISPADVPLAHLTGVAAWQPTDEQVAAVKNYVEAGGVLLIDPCGGPNAFDQAVREQLLPKAFPTDEMDRIDPNHPLLTNSGDGMVNVSTVKVRLFVRDTTLANGRQLQMIRAGKGFVIVSPLDMTCGVLGLHQWGIAGYDPDYCLNFARNLVLWTWDGENDPK